MVGLCSFNCDKCNYKEYCGGCSLCEAAICKHYCSRCEALCPHRIAAIKYFDSLKGPYFSLLENHNIELPKNIPVLPDKLNVKINKNIIPVIGVHAGNMFSRNGRKINNRYLEKGYAGALNVDPNIKAILEFYTKDRTLEGFWENRMNIYNDIKKLEFYAVISPNYSVYEDAPRIDHLYNIKRTAIVYNEMIERGINAVPDISWYGINDLERWCNEINKSKCKVISFSFQVVDIALKASTTWKNYLLAFRYLCQNISPDVKIIIAGIISHRRIEQIQLATTACQSIHILNQSAYVQSRRGILSETMDKYDDINFDELFLKNLNFYNNY